jgi:hypothetical protein
MGERQLDEAIEALPTWIPCPCCENYLCTVHMTHAHECQCPSIEEWSTDPYSDRAGGRLAPAEKKCTEAQAKKRDERGKRTCQTP